MKKSLGYITAVVAGLAFMSAHAEDAKPKKELRSITVVGEAHKRVRPDMASFSTTIQEMGKTQAEAKAKLDNKLRAWLTIASNFGVAKNDLSTGYTAVSRQYDWQDNKQIFRGFVANSTLGITFRDMDRMPQLQDALVKAGFESVSGPDYQLDASSDYANEALRDALRNAQKKAEDMAWVLQQRVGQPLSINEGFQQEARPVPMAKTRMMAMEADAAAPAPTPEGVIELSANVTVTFQLLDN